MQQNICYHILTGCHAFHDIQINSTECQFCDMVNNIMLHKEIFFYILLFAVTLRHFTFCTNSSAYIMSCGSQQKFWIVWRNRTTLLISLYGKNSNIMQPSSCQKTACVVLMAEVIIFGFFFLGNVSFHFMIFYFPFQVKTSFCQPLGCCKESRYVIFSTPLLPHPS